MKFQRGKIADVTVGPRWRIRHIADKLPRPKTGAFDIVGAADENEATAKVQAAYARPRIIVSLDRLD